MSKGMLRQAHNRKQLELFQDIITNIVRRAVCQHAIWKDNGGLSSSRFEEIPYALYKENL